MRSSSRIVVAITAQLVMLLGGPLGRARAATETYLFRDSFQPQEGAGNVLVPVSNATNTIVTSGPDFVNGTFVTETISASACASTPTIRAWSFPDRGGLRHDNATPTVVTGSYSISMLMRYNPMDGGYARLIDFSSSTQDTGIYKLGNGVSFYPVGTFASGSFVQDQDVFVSITRDAGTQLVSLYINGVPSGTYTDINNLYAPSATVVYFLMDNTTGNAAIYETDPGVIAYLQVRDTPMTPEEVTASLAAICDVVAASTTTTTQVGATTTTTTLPQTCVGTPDGPTFASILCRIAALADRVDGESGLGAFQSKLAKSLETARSRADDARTLCEASNLKKTKKRLQQSAKALSQYVHRLAGLTARKKLDAALRTDFLQAGQAIEPDVKTLRTQAVCPPA
jgi:hypothetical protein